jgi:hypothetical protein
VLVRWISDQQRHLVAPTLESSREIATAMVVAKGEFQPVGEHWLTRLRRRHSELGAGRSTALDLDHLTSLTPAIIDIFFTQIDFYMTEYSIPWGKCPQHG